MDAPIAEKYLIGAEGTDMRHERNFSLSEEDYQPTRVDALLRLAVLACSLLFWIGIIALVASLLG